MLVGALAELGVHEHRDVERVDGAVADHLHVAQRGAAEESVRDGLLVGERLEGPRAVGWCGAVVVEGAAVERAERRRPRDIEALPQAARRHQLERGVAPPGAILDERLVLWKKAPIWIVGAPVHLRPVDLLHRDELSGEIAVGLEDVVEDAVEWIGRDSVDEVEAARQRRRREWWRRQWNR